MEEQMMASMMDDDDFRTCDVHTSHRDRFRTCDFSYARMSSASSAELPTSHLSSHIKRQDQGTGGEGDTADISRCAAIEAGRRRLAAEEYAAQYAARVPAEEQAEALYTQVQEAYSRKRCWRDVALRERERKNEEESRNTLT
jgi:hypothetical protein